MSNIKNKLTNIDGVFHLNMNMFKDDRGSFSRVFCNKDFRINNFNVDWCQINISHTIPRGTIRGLHYQTKPFEEKKLIRCIHGKIFDVIVDVRKNSPTFGKYYKTELNSQNNDAIIVHEGLAHGFQTLTEDAKILYFHSAPFDLDHSVGINPFDPKINIKWPLECSLISEKDTLLPFLSNK